MPRWPLRGWGRPGHPSSGGWGWLRVPPAPALPPMWDPGRGRGALPTLKEGDLSHSLPLTARFLSLDPDLTEDGQTVNLPTPQSRPGSPRKPPARTDPAQGAQPPRPHPTGRGSWKPQASFPAGLREQTQTETTGIPDARPNFVLNSSLQRYFVVCWFLFFIFWPYHRARLPRPGLNKTRIFYSVVQHCGRPGWAGQSEVGLRGHPPASSFP